MQRLKEIKNWRGWEVVGQWAILFGIIMAAISWSHYLMHLYNGVS